MIRRRRLPQAGDTRTLTRRAWLPKRFKYKGEQVTVWLEQYVVEQKYGECLTNAGRHMFHRVHSLCWSTMRVLSLADACLEKLNPEPAPTPPPSAAQTTVNAALQQWLKGLANSNVSQPLGMPASAFQQQITSYTKASSP